MGTLDRKWIRATVKSGVGEGKGLGEIKWDILQVARGQGVDNYVNFKYFKYYQLQLGEEIKGCENWDQISAERLTLFGNRVYSARRLNELPEGIQNLPHFLLIVQEDLKEEDEASILQRIQACVATVIYEPAQRLLSGEDKTSTYLRQLKETYLLLKNVFLSSTGYPLYSKKENGVLWRKFRSDHPALAKKHEEAADALDKELCHKLADLYYDSEVKGHLEKIRHSLLEHLLKPLSWELLCQHGKLTLVAIKPVMLISECLPDIESVITSHRSDVIEEVHFLASEVIYINANLEKSIWHGKNLVVMSKKVECIVPNLVWDVSGNLGKGWDPYARAQNGTETDPDGKDGEDGAPGESGGNGMIITDTFKNAHFLTFKSNGGSGGHGQRGGNGTNGKHGNDGEGMSLEELKTDFPSPALIDVENSRKCLLTILDNFRHDTETEITLITFEYSYMLKKDFNPQPLHLQGCTKSGLQIEFSFNFDHFCHSYILVKGALGEPGELGGYSGSGGCGGQGGFPGKLYLCHLNCSEYADEEKFKATIVGENGATASDGMDGNDGSRGSCGRNGKDVGYLDSQFWRKTDYYGPGTFELKNTKNDATKVWCHHNNSYRTIKTTKRDPPQPLEQTRRKPVKVKTKVAASKKNGILASQIVNSYAEQFQNSCEFEFGSVHLQEAMEKVLLSRGKSVGKEQSNIEQNVLLEKPSRREKSCKKEDLRGTFSRKKEEGTEDEIKVGLLKKLIPKSTPLWQVRLEALKEIEEKMKPEWERWSKVKTTFVKHPTHSKSNDSAFHALFGEVNNLGYFEAPVGKRAEVCHRLKMQNSSSTFGSVPIPIIQDVMFTLEEPSYELIPEVKKLVKESLLAYFQDESSLRPHMDVKMGLSKCSTDKLDEYCEIFKSGPGNFDWAQVLRDERAVKQYFDFLANPSIPFLVSDLKLVGEVYGFRIQLYSTSDSSPECTPFRLEADPELGTNVDVDYIHIAVNEHDEFCRMVLVRERDMEQMYTKMEKIVRDVYSFKSESEIKTYLASRAFTDEMSTGDGKSSGESKMSMISDIAGNIKKYLVTETLKGILTHAQQDRDDETLMLIVREISASFEDPEEKLLVEVTLLQWPSIFLQVFHQRMTTTSGNSFSQSYHLMFNTITDYSISDKKKDKLPPFLWAMAVHSEECWTRDICLVYLEEYFEAVEANNVAEWKSKLEGFPEQLVFYILKLIKSGVAFDKKDKPSFVSFLESIGKFEVNDSMEFGKLDGLKKSQWPYQLQKLFLSSKLRALPNVQWNNTQNKEAQALYYLYSLYNKNRKEVTKLLDLLQKTLSTQSKPCPLITSILAKFYGGLWDLNMETIQLLQRCSTLGSWIRQLNAGKGLETGNGRSVEEIRDIVKDDSNSNFTNLDVTLIMKYLTLLRNIQLPEEIDPGVKIWLPSFQQNIKEKKLTMESIQSQLEAVAYIDFVIGKKLGFNLRDTQKFAIVAALYLGAKGRNLLSQIATGEGKTCVVLAEAIVRALFGEKVDIITSSSVLARRDAEDYQEIYKCFGLSVGEVTGQSQDKRMRAYQCDVVYGEASHFQRDHLLDRFYSQNIRGARPFENVIVDEVDSMFLDKGNSVLYLSHQPPDLDSLEDLFVFIWTNVVEIVNTGELNPAKIYELVISAIHAIIGVEDLFLIVEDGGVTPLWEWMVTAKLINSRGRLIGDLTSSKAILGKLPETFRKVRKQLEYLIKSKLEAPGRLKVMTNLKPFIDLHLFTWISAAFQATQLTEGKEYVVDVDRSNTCLDKNPKVVILDLDTGVDMKDSQWNEALHQFLELKHGCRLSLMSLKAVFISNISFFNKYQRKFGLTGTIGTESDRNFLKTTYKVDFISIPLALPKRFTEEEPLICRDKATWKEHIFTETKSKLGSCRSVLIICGTVQEAEVLCLHFKRTEKSIPVQLYKRDYESFKVTQENQKLETGQVIIATNLAGRGTDIKISQELKNAGGLHVILSYLPDNLRVEQQAFGRAARCGDPGSGRLIFIDNMFSNKVTPEYLLDAISLKIRRDDLEMSRVSDIQTYYETVIRKEEEMFERFQRSYDELERSLQNAYKYIQDHSGEVESKSFEKNLKEMKDLILCSLIDDWAFWLDRYSILLSNKRSSSPRAKGAGDLHEFGTQENENSVIEKFIRMISLYDTISERYKDPSWLENCWTFLSQKVGLRQMSKASIEDYALSLIHEPALFVKVAKCFISRKEYILAEKYLDKVIDQEVEHSVPALYYKLLCNVKEDKWTTSEFQCLAKTVSSKLEQLKIREAWNANAISEITSVSTQAILHGDGYRRQKENMMQILDAYLISIEDLVGKKTLLPSDFNFTCNPNACESLFQHLIDEGALLQASFCYFHMPEKLRQLSDSFRLREDHVKNILKSLEGKELVPEVEKELKEKLDLPSRGSFWKEIKDCLQDFQEFAVIENGASFSCENPEMKNEFRSWVDGRRPYISKYGSYMCDDSGLNVIKGSKEDFMCHQKFRYLRKMGQVCFEQLAHLDIDKLKSIKLRKYHKIEKHAFLLIPGIGKEESERIFEILKAASVTDEDGTLLDLNWVQDKLDLTLDFEVYRSKILDVLHSSCIYKFQILSILQQFKDFQSENNEPCQIQVSLPTRPTKHFVMTALDLGFILGVRPNPSYFREKAKVTNKLETAATPCLNRNHLQKLFPEEVERHEKMYEDLKNKNWIKSDGEIIPEMAETGLENLSEELHYHQQEILALAEWLQEKVKPSTMSDALSFISACQGALKTLKNPDVELINLSDKLKEDFGEKHGFSLDIKLLSLSGFDDVIQNMEKRHSFKMVSNTLIVMSMGVFQIGLGLKLIHKVRTCKVLCEQGIGDIMYCMESFRSGHFSWKDWTTHKRQSLTITGFHIGVDALSRGIRNFKSGTKTSIKTTPQAAPVIVQSVRSTLAQTFTSQAVDLIPMAINIAYEKAVKRYVDHFCLKLFANTEKAVSEHNISKLLDNLVSTVGVDEGQRILNKCTTNVMETSRLEVDSQFTFDKMRIPLMEPLKVAIEEMSKAGVFSNQDSMMLMKFMNVLHSAMNLASIIKVLCQSTHKHLNELEKEVKREMSGLHVVHVLSPIVAQQDRENFIYKFKESTNFLMKEKIGGVMESTFIRPLLQFGAQKVISGVSRAIDKRRGMNRREMEKVKSIYVENNMHSNSLEERKMEMHSRIAEVCSKSRDPKVIAHAVELGGRLGVESMQPVADLLKVRIVVESDDPAVPKEVTPKNGQAKKTLHLKCTVSPGDSKGLGQMTWSAEGKLEASSVESGGFLDALNQRLRIDNPHSPLVSRTDLANFMRRDKSFQEFVRNGGHQNRLRKRPYGCPEVEKTKQEKIKKRVQGYHRKILEKKLLQERKSESYRFEEDKGQVIFQVGEIFSKSPEKASSERSSNSIGDIVERMLEPPGNSYNALQHRHLIKNRTCKDMQMSLDSFHLENKGTNSNIGYMLKANEKRTSIDCYFTLNRDGKVAQEKVLQIPIKGRQRKKHLNLNFEVKGNLQI